ncbi:MAG: PRC-barrel domain-containing protein [Candidatus Dormibacteraeota bacterium]|nr:PRC-barrel domain-containing protein [Candidatus Dormibacteraeota bacterium]
MSERPSLDDLHFGAVVYASDGVQVGTLHRLVVDEESLDPHSVVVKETRHFSGHHLGGSALIEDDVAIPLSDVRSAHHDRVELAVDSTAVRHTVPYLSYRYAPLTGRDAANMVLAQIGQSAYIPRLIEEAHKRLDELEITPGENVMLGRSGRKLGTVRDVLFDGNEMIGVVMHPGLFKEDVVLQVRFLGRSDDLALFAHLTEDDLQHLQPFHPE